MPEITQRTLTYKRVQAKKSRKKRTFVRAILAVFTFSLILSSFGYYRYANASTELSSQATNTYNFPASTPLAWPAYGQAAVGSEKYGLLANTENQTPVPTASTAKLITVLAVLESKPLRIGSQGPTITLTQKDVAIKDAYVAQDGSVVAVEAGQQITQYQALQAVLLPSSNNMADSLAIWTFGSLENYTSYANQMLQSYGITHTTVGTDASGLSPSTKSTASDLVLIGQRAMKNPIIAEIVAQKQATIPVAGVIRNTNFILGQDNIIGLKTGNTDEAGRVFVLAGKHTLENGQEITMITAIMGSPSFEAVMQDSKTLFASAKANLVFVNIVKAGEQVAQYNAPWGGTYKAVSKNTINGPIWLPSSNQPQMKLDTINGGKLIGDTVGNIEFKRADGVTLKSEVRLAENIPGPSIKWRIFGGEDK